MSPRRSFPPPDLDPDQCVRDLIWALESPSLLSDSSAVPSIAAPPNIDGDHLKQFLLSGWNHRVGYYFENLIHYWLKHIRGLEVRHRVQIREGKRTLGELDFLFVDESGQTTHLETAVKFYLASITPHESGSHLIGPNAADTFERKCDRLFDHQLPLSGQHFSDVAIRHAFVRGQIFYHPDDQQSEKFQTHRLSRNHARGLWIHADELPQICQSGFRYAVLKKPFWLGAPMVASEWLVETKIQNWIENHFVHSSNPILLSCCDLENQSEVVRIFVVSGHWPARE